MAAISAQFWSKTSDAQLEPGRVRKMSSIVQLGSALKMAEARAKHNKIKIGPSPVKEAKMRKLRRAMTVPSANSAGWPGTPSPGGGAGAGGGGGGGLLQASVALRSIAAAKKAAYHERQKHAAADTDAGGSGAQHD
eukprot:SAG22_NODE_5596_length_987_cov_1.477477_1_plen_135_part_10